MCWVRPILRRLAACVVILLSGCETYRELRAYFHDDQGDDQASLLVEVIPKTGISILLDGKHVARESPYLGQALSPGTHELEVRGMGYMPFSLPVELKNGATMKVPVRLRARHTASPPEEDPTPVSKPVRMKKKNARGSAPPEGSIAESVGPLLPPGVAPMALKIISQPPSTVTIDGVRSESQTLLRHRWGVLEIGDVSLRYRVGAQGVLKISLPNPAGQSAGWTKDGQPVESSRPFSLHRGATRLMRQDPTRPLTIMLARP